MNSQPGVVSGVVARSPWWVPWGFLLITLIAYATVQGMAVSNVAERNQEARAAIREAMILSCERNNIDRQAHNEQNVVLREILTGAAAATDDLDRRNDMLTYAARIVDVEVADCEAAFPEGVISRASFGG